MYESWPKKIATFVMGLVILAATWGVGTIAFVVIVRFLRGEQ